ncbi:hypothetical protein BCR34DRAFT_577451 [Clohesyomyces aquaticus]|uniref:TauD/TfdA-like domain-containing protein n=1 Tax=Clohesyomyces aquaticus TaxID=1231657 RepID=A0A1Y1YJJ1_9PLEO|nr:hypothetical protein BCR34DRAFT_577451 [Clohesyomyces aquaticus]
MTYFKGLELEIRDLSRQNFPLPRLSKQLEKLRNELHDGKGFFVLRGIDPTRYSVEDNVLIFVGVSCYIGEKRGRQDQDGNMLVHIMDANARFPSPAFREAQSVYTNVAQPFHNDVVCDILALQTLSRASEGGSSIIASAVTVYNELAATRPDLVHTLSASDWTFDTFGRDPPYHQRPLLYCHDRRVILNFSRRLLTGSDQSPRTANIPPITEAQAEALDAVHFIAQDNQLSISTAPGDLRFINNLGILHCRDSFQDGAHSQRHLVRLWLRNEQMAWSTPTQLQMAWDRVFADLPDMAENWNIEPDMSEAQVSSRQKSCGQG